jgi:glycosyltransferase involved in cell wall biosynthesis
MVVGNSRFILEQHLNAGAFANARSAVIYNGYRPVRPVNPRAPCSSGRPWCFGYIGRLAPTKGLELLIQAFRQVAAVLPEPVCLRIAGSGAPDYVARLKALASGLPISFLGHVEPQIFYAGIDITVVPSLWDEPLARVLFESFAHGIPVLASTRGGNAELVTPGRTGWLFDVDGLRTLESSLLTAAHCCGSDQYRALSATCLAESARFLPERTFEAYMAVWSAVGSEVSRESCSA